MIAVGLLMIVASVLQGRGEAGHALNRVGLVIGMQNNHAPHVPPEPTTPREAAPPSLRASRVPPEPTTPCSGHNLAIIAASVPLAHTAYPGRLHAHRVPPDSTTPRQA